MLRALKECKRTMRSEHKRMRCPTLPLDTEIGPILFDGPILSHFLLSVILKFCHLFISHREFPQLFAPTNAVNKLVVKCKFKQSVPKSVMADVETVLTGKFRYPFWLEKFRYPF